MWLWRLGAARRSTLDAYLEWMDGGVVAEAGVRPAVLVVPCSFVLLSAAPVRAASAATGQLQGPLLAGTDLLHELL